MEYRVNIPLVILLVLATVSVLSQILKGIIMTTTVVPSFPTYPVTTFENAVDATIFSSNQLGEIVNGDATTTVATVNGDVPTLRKSLVDNFYFKTPTAWVSGGTETVFNQLHYYTGVASTTGWYYSPAAASTNPVVMGSTPVGDNNWRLYQIAIPDNNSIMLEIGSFTVGETVNRSGDLLRYADTTGQVSWCKYVGTLPHTVSYATPDLDGGIYSTTNPTGLWVVVGGTTLSTPINTINTEIGTINTEITAINTSVTAVNTALTNFEAGLSNTSDITMGDALIGVNQPFTLSVARTQHDKNKDEVNVKDFGATGDGVTDDTTAIQNAINYACSVPCRLFFPYGTYMVSHLVIYPNSNIRGEGRNCSIIKRLSTSTGDVITGYQSYSLFGITSSTSLTGYCCNVTIGDLTIDGGVSTYSSTATGNGIAIWGSRLRFYNLDIKNCANHGIWTDYFDSNYDYGMPWYESSFHSIRISNCGMRGWHFAGPHDSSFMDVTIIDASRIANNTYEGFYATSNTSAVINTLHVSNTNQSIRHKYAGNFEGPCICVGSSFEGAYSGNLRIACSGGQFDPSCTYYAAWNGVNILLDGTCTLNRIEGLCAGPAAGQPACIGLTFATTSVSTQGNYINLVMNSQEAAPVSFQTTTKDTGYNDIKLKVYSSTGSGVYGLPSPTTHLVLDSFGGSVSHIDNWRQTTILTIPAASSATWTYPFAYAAVPQVHYNMLEPSTTPTGQLWTTGRSATSVVIYNSNSTSVNVAVSAFTSSY